MNLRKISLPIIFNVVIFICILTIGILPFIIVISYGNELGDLAYVYGIWLVIITYLIFNLAIIHGAKQNKLKLDLGIIYYVYSLKLVRGTVRDNFKDRKK